MIRWFLNARPRNSFPHFYVIILGRGYLHNHLFSNRFYILAAWLSLYCTISNHPVAGSIIVKAFSIRVSSWPYLLILFGPIRSTNNISHGISYGLLAVNLPYVKFFFPFFWIVLQTIIWARISSLKSVHL